MSKRVRVLAVLVVFGLALSWLAVNHAQPAAAADQDEDDDQPAYVCPNHPEVWSDKPGVCPKCGAELVKQKKSN